MATQIRTTADQLEGGYIRSADALRDALAFLDVALQRITRLYPSHSEHEHREAIRQIHGDVAGLYCSLDAEYTEKFGVDVGTLMKMVRREVAWPIETEKIEAEAAQ